MGPGLSSIIIDNYPALRLPAFQIFGKLSAQFYSFNFIFPIFQAWIAIAVSIATFLTFTTYTKAEKTVRVEYCFKLNLEKFDDELAI